MKQMPHYRKGISCNVVLGLTYLSLAQVAARVDWPGPGELAG